MLTLVMMLMENEHAVSAVRRVAVAPSACCYQRVCELAIADTGAAMQVIGDFAVVWLLSPRRSFQPPPTRRLAKALAALPAHCLQVRWAAPP